MKLGENIMRQSLEWQEYPPPPHHPPWSFISNFKIKSKEIVFVLPPVFYHGNGSRISFGLIAVYDWSFIWRWLTIWPSMTHGSVRIDSLGMMAYGLNPRDPCERIAWLVKWSELAYTVGNKTVWMFGSFGLCIEYIYLLNGQISGNILTYNTPSQLYNKSRI